jgi:hypothetical protein
VILANCSSQLSRNKESFSAVQLGPINASMYTCLTDEISLSNNISFGKPVKTKLQRLGVDNLYSKRIGPDKVKLTRVVLDIERVSAFKT